MARPVKKQRGIFERPKGSGVWWICYFDQYGRKHREKVGMKAAALTVYQQRKTEVRQGKFEPEDVKGKHQHATVSEIIKDGWKSRKPSRLLMMRKPVLSGGTKNLATDQRGA